MRKESIFDLYNEQHKGDKKPEPERLPEEVAPETEPEKEVTRDSEPEKEAAQDPESEKEGGSQNGT